MAGRGFAGGQRPPREGIFGHENFGDNMEGFRGSNPRFQFGGGFHQGAFRGGVRSVEAERSRKELVSE